MNALVTSFKKLVLLLVLATIAACGSFSAGIEIPTPTGEAAATQFPATTRPQETQAPIEPAPTQAPDGSPSVLRVAYVKDGNVWLWTEGGIGAALTSSGGVVDVKLSDDGQVMAFLRQVDEFHNELWAVNTDGGNERRLVSVDQLEAMDPDRRDPNSRGLTVLHYDFVPAAHTVAFNTSQIYQGPTPGNFDDLRLVDADSASLSTLLPPGEGGEFYYSPNGSKIAVVTPTLISAINADGSRRNDMLIYERVTTYSEYWYYARPIWSADSSFLRVALPPADPLAEPRQPTTLWHIPTDGLTAYELGSVQAMPFFGAEVAFSPDLTRIIHMNEAGRPEENLRELIISNTEGTSSLLFLTAPLLQFEGWAGSNTQFVFGLGEDRSLQLGQASGGFGPLTDDPVGITGLRWLNPERFLYSKAKDSAWELRLGVLGGGSTLLDSFSGEPPSYDFVH